MDDEIDIAKRLRATAKELAGHATTLLASYRMEEAAESIEYQRRAMRDAAKIIEAQDKLLVAARAAAAPPAARPAAGDILGPAVMGAIEDLRRLAADLGPRSLLERSSDLNALADRLVRKVCEAAAAGEPGVE